MHAVISTGEKTKPLDGGRSRYTSQGVPILELRNGAAKKVEDAQDALLDPKKETRLLTGEIVHLHNPTPQYQDGADVVTWHIGGETLDEAAKSVVGSYENTYGNEPPSWVASTNDDLADVISDHFDCEVRDMNGELTA